jgi:hypothetical protein
MAILLNPRVWIALALAAVLAFSHTFVYRAGRAAVRADWNAQKVIDAKAAEAASEANRLKEQTLQANLTKAQDDASKREKTLRAAAAGARTERDRLRDAIAAATGGLLPSDTASTVLARAATLGGLLDQCTARYTEVAEHASGHASDAVMLRDGWPKP